MTNYKQPEYLIDWFHYEVVDRHHTHFMLSPAATRVVMRNWPAGEEGNDTKERGYVLVHLHTPISAKKHVWRVVVNCPVKHKSKGDPEDVDGKAGCINVSGSCRGGQVGTRAAAIHDGVSRRGLSGGVLEAGHRYSSSRKIFIDLMREERGGAEVAAAE